MDERTIHLDEWTDGSNVNISLDTSSESVVIREASGYSYTSKQWLDRRNTRCQTTRPPEVTDFVRSYDVEEITVKLEPTSPITIEAEWDGQPDSVIRDEVNLCGDYEPNGNCASESYPIKHATRSEKAKSQSAMVVSHHGDDSKLTPCSNDQDGCDVPSEKNAETDEQTYHKPEPKSVTKKPVYNCSVCNKEYLYKWRLDNHLSIVHCRDPSDSSPEKPVVKTKPTKEETTSPEKKPTYSCKLCGKTYTYLWRLDNHFRLVHRRTHWKLQSVKSKQVQPPKPEKPTHFCKVCSKAYLYEYHLNYHMRIHHPPPRSSQSVRPRKTYFHSDGVKQEKPVHFCKVCKKAYLYQWRLHAHIRTQHGGSARNVQSVNFEASSPVKPSSLQENKQADNPGKSKVYNLEKMKSEPAANSVLKCEACNICGKQYLRASNLENHIRLAHPTVEKQVGGKSWQCKDCDRSYTRRSNLNIHINASHPEKLKSLTSSVNKHELCKYCGKIFLRAGYLENHIRLHHSVTGRRTEKKRWRCTNCDKSFVTKGGLSKHVHQQHPKPGSQITKTWQCKDCDKSYTRKDNLNVHVRSAHPKKLETTPKLGEVKCEACKFCGKKYARMEHVENHIRRCHPDEVDSASVNKKTRTRLQCQHCDKSFVRKGHLRTHVQRNHGRRASYRPAVGLLVRSCQCNYCGILFPRVSYLKAHVQQYHAEKVNSCSSMQSLSKSKQCEHCGKRYIRQSSLVNHICRGPETSGVASSPVELKSASPTPQVDEIVENKDLDNLP